MRDEWRLSAGFDEESVLALLQDPATQRRGFSKVVSEFSRPLYWQIRRMVFTHDDANDVLQDTLLSAWMNIDHFRGESKLSTWLFRIAANQCLSFLSKKKNRPMVSLDDSEAAFAHTLAADPYFSGDEAQLLLQRALYSLPDKQRMVFNLRYFDNMTYTDMSDIMGTAVGTLKSEYHIAVKKVAKFLEKA